MDKRSWVALVPIFLIVFLACAAPGSSTSQRPRIPLCVGTRENLTFTWTNENFDGFYYDADSGNYSESLVITNLTDRRIPEGGLTYTSYIRRVLK
jgi:hypothetical protein